MGEPPVLHPRAAAEPPVPAPPARLPSLSRAAGSPPPASTADCAAAFLRRPLLFGSRMVGPLHMGSPRGLPSPRPLAQARRSSLMRVRGCVSRLSEKVRATAMRPENCSSSTSSEDSCTDGGINRRQGTQLINRVMYYLKQHQLLSIIVVYWRAGLESVTDPS
ncbi:hypothetical protein U9M48_009080 [Paspalum notatum var. saurae]|uniref:Uncharacterized protein n=1 Tax=Paspalum notatum var. saurae TaxID=547442 RepID=A0AAQ3SRK5_PASNO